MHGSLLRWRRSGGFSALQRAEIAEIIVDWLGGIVDYTVSVLFNEPKLLKFIIQRTDDVFVRRVSVLFNEPKLLKYQPDLRRERREGMFQCSSTSRNC